MKILHIIPSLYGGGAEKFAIDLCNELSKKHEVIICSFFDVDDTMFMAKNLHKNVKLVTFNKQTGFDISIFFKVYRLIKNENVDAVNTHLRALVYSLLPIIFTSVVFFHTVHNMAQKETGRFNRFVYKLLFRFFSVTPVAISSKVLESVQKEYGNRFNDLVDNGIKPLGKTYRCNKVKQEIEKYKKDKDTSVFITIGRISQQKNHKMLIDVFNQLIKEGKNIILLIIGDDYSKDQQLLKELSNMAKEDIFFLGMIENIADYLLCSDAFCLSSLYEGLPITLLESLSLGIVPICTPAGGIVDVIDDNIGFISTDFSPEAYQTVIKQYLDLSPKEKEQFSENGEKLFDLKYNISQTAENYIKLYQHKLN